MPKRRRNYGAGPIRAIAAVAILWSTAVALCGLNDRRAEPLYPLGGEAGLADVTAPQQHHGPPVRKIDGTAKGVMQVSRIKGDGLA